MTGDQSDMLQRLRRRLPHWFGQDQGATPILDGLLQGPAWALAFVYSLWAYAKLQTRIATATDGWLDMIAADFFGTSLLRSPNQSDASFRARIIANLIRERATRHAVIKVLTDVTGRVPIVFEPASVIDTGALAMPLSAGYCGVARCGSYAVPFTAMVTAFRPNVAGGLAGQAWAGEPSVSGLATPLSIGFLGSLALQTTAASDHDIYAAVDSVRPVGTIIWVAITNDPGPVPGPGYWPGEFRLDISTLGGSDVLG